MSGDGLQRKFGDAVALHQSGRLDEAERVYRQVLRRVPRNDDALHLLGILHHQKGDHGEAERLVAEAIRIRPSVVAYYENLAVVQRALRKLAAVAETCLKGLARGGSDRLSAALIEALLELGQFQELLAFLDDVDRRSPPAAGRLADRAHCLLQLGRLDEAADAAGKALALEAANANARSALAGVATRRGDHGGAAAHWHEILRLRPEWPAALVNLGLSLVRANDARGALATLDSGPLPNDPLGFAALLNVRAAAHRQLKQPAEAARYLRQALAVCPASAEYLSNLSELIRGAGASAALILVDRALACDRLLAGAFDNRGLALAELDRLEAAVVAHRRAIALAPSDPAMLNNLADPLRWFGLRAEAECLYRRSLTADPAFAPAIYSYGTLQLGRGEVAKGWIGYERRFEADPHFVMRPFPHPRWNGGPLAGKLLVWSEQGLGDELIFGTILPELPRRGIRAIVECDPRMVSIFSRAMPAIDFVRRSDPPQPRLLGASVEAQVAMGSLARRYRGRFEDFPEQCAYLTPRQDLFDHWRRRLAELGPGPKIGFSWRSRRVDAVARLDHPPVLDWAPVLTQPGVKFVSLQYGEAESDIDSVESMLGVKVHTFADLDLKDDLEGVLALSAAVDLTISSPNTPFCLSAAVGAPIWLLVPNNALWLLGTDRLPWFPNLRAYVHSFALPRSLMIDRIASDFSAWVSNREASRGR